MDENKENKIGQAGEKTVIQWYPGHMAKARRGITEDLALVDVVVEVLDARIPASSRNPELAQLAKNKPQVLVLNKKDLAEEAATALWLSEYRRMGYSAVALTGAQKQGTSILLRAIAAAAEPLMRSLEAKGRLRRPVRAMMVGVPNTGKSTLINAIAPKNAVIAGAKPGLTKARQWVRTAENIELLDTPGILWPRFTSSETAYNLAFCGCISHLVYPLVEVAEKLADFLAQNIPQVLLERYGFNAEKADPAALLQAVGRKRGLLATGGTVRIEDAALKLLQEFQSGKLGRFTLDSPRGEDEHPARS